MNKIDFRKTSQDIGNVYVWIDKDKVQYGINGTSFHGTISRDKFKNHEISEMVFHEIHNNKDCKWEER